MVSEHTKTIQPLENSVVQKVLVKDGDHVEARQALDALDPTLATADKASVAEQRKAAESEVLRTASLLRVLDSPGAVNITSANNASFAKGLPAAWKTETNAAQAQLNAEWSDIAAKMAKLGAENDEKRGAIFPVTLQLGRHDIDIDGKPIRLGPGMNVTAEIKTGKRRVIEYLLGPIQRAGNESLHER